MPHIPRSTTVPRFTIAVAAKKGGVGKTTLTVSLASIFAHHKLRTLVVDLDPQSNAGYVLGVDPVAPGTFELLTGKPVQPLATLQAGLSVLPGGIRLVEHSIMILEPTALANAIKRFADFDVILFDCPPGHELLERLAMRAANVAIGVTDAHPLAYTGLAAVLADLERARQHNAPVPSRIAIALSKLDPRRKLDREAGRTVAEICPDLPQFPIRCDAKLAQVTAAHTPLMLASAGRRSEAVAEIEKIAKWSVQ